MSLCIKRFRSPMLLGLVVAFAASASGLAADFQAVVLDEAPPNDQLAPPIAQSLKTQGIAVKEGDRTVCEIWLSKVWQVQSDFQPTFQLLYPFKEGQLVGVIRYPRRGYDFRDQEIGRGVYTLRYALQPVDGNHVGTSPTRDFLVLLPAEQDKSVEPITPDQAIEQSTEVSETSHPAFLALRQTQDPTSDLPAMRHDEANDWWIVQLAGNSGAEGEAGRVRVDLVVVGAAAE